MIRQKAPGGKAFGRSQAKIERSERAMPEFSDLRDLRDLQVIHIHGRDSDRLRGDLWLRPTTPHGTLELQIADR